MSNLASSLSRIEQHLDERIQILSRINSHYVDILRCVRVRDSLVDAVRSSVNLKEVKTIESNIDAAVEATDGPVEDGSLDAILKRARDIRLCQPESKTKDTPGDKKASIERNPRAHNKISSKMQAKSAVRGEEPAPTTSTSLRNALQRQANGGSSEKIVVDGQVKNKSHVVTSGNSADDGSDLYRKVDDVIHRLNGLKKVKPLPSITELCSCEIRSNSGSSSATGQTTNTGISSDRLHIPSSIPFLLVSGLDSPAVIAEISALMTVKQKVDESTLTSSEPDPLHSLVLNLKTSFLQQKLKFERVLRSRLSRVSVNQLSKEDVEEVIRAWFKLRKLLQIYEIVSTGAKQSPLTSENLNSVNDVSCSELDYMLLCKTTVECLPLVTPISGLGKISSSRSYSRTAQSHEWLQSRISDVNYFYELLQIRVMFAIETLYGKQPLRELIRKLKRTAEVEISNNSALRMDTVARNHMWKESLREFRDLYNCLVNGAEPGESCIFFHPS